MDIDTTVRINRELVKKLKILAIKEDTTLQQKIETILKEAIKAKK